MPLTKEEREAYLAREAAYHKSNLRGVQYVYLVIEQGEDVPSYTAYATRALADQHVAQKRWTILITLRVWRKLFV